MAEETKNPSVTETRQGLSRRDLLVASTALAATGVSLSDRAFVVVPSQAIVAKWLQSFEEFPIRQKPASFNLDEVMQKLSAPKN